MKKLLILTAAAILAGCATTDHRDAAVLLEFRTASESPGPGLTAMTATGSEYTVYVSDEAVLSNADVRSARVIAETDPPHIEVVFTETGAERFAELTENNIGKPFAILVDGALISAPTIQSPITGGTAMITGHFSEDEAQRIADGIAGRRTGGTQ